MDGVSARLLPEVAVRALPGAVLVARPGGVVRHVAVTAGLTGQGRIRRTERPLCGLAGRSSWSTRRGAGRPLCVRCNTRTWCAASREQLVAAARGLTAADVARVLEEATTLEQVDAVRALLIAVGAALWSARQPWRYGGTRPLQALVADARDRVAPRPSVYAMGRPIPRLYPRSFRRAS